MSKIIETVSFNVENIIEVVIKRLEYIAGKRAETDMDYYRVRACGADSEMLRSLTCEAIVELEVLLGEKLCKIDERLIFGALVKLVIYSWLMLIGDKEIENRKAVYENEIKELLEAAVRGSRNASPRTVPPI